MMNKKQSNVNQVPSLNPNQYSKVTTRYEMDASEKAQCPYCGNVFGSQNDRCPNCGAGISRIENKIVITKTEEIGINERIAEFQHKEKMAAYEEKKRDDKKSIYLIAFIFAAPILMILLEKLIKILTK